MVSPKVLWPVTSSIVKCMYIQINVQFISALEQSSIYDMTEDFRIEILFCIHKKYWRTIKTKFLSTCTNLIMLTIVRWKSRNVSDFYQIRHSADDNSQPSETQKSRWPLPSINGKDVNRLTSWQKCKDWDSQASYSALYISHFSHSGSPHLKTIINSNLRLKCPELHCNFCELVHPD